MYMHTLKELAYDYFKSLGYKVQMNVTIMGTVKNNLNCYDMVCTDIKNNKEYT